MTGLNYNLFAVPDWMTLAVLGLCLACGPVALLLLLLRWLR